jgi:uncharacterized membrane protein YdjX (TVP38/TMEM64 family)
MVLDGFLHNTHSAAQVYIGIDGNDEYKQGGKKEKDQTGIIDNKLLRFFIHTLVSIPRKKKIQLYICIFFGKTSQNSAVSAANALKIPVLKIERPGDKWVEYADMEVKFRRRLVIFSILFCIATLVMVVLFWPFIKELQDPAYRDAFSSWVSGLGPAGFFILLGLQILQIVIAVIPGGPVELIAGAAYGAWAGLGICAAGCVIASSLVFLTVKKFGLPLLRRFFGEKDLMAWKFLGDSKKTARVVFILFLIPGTPKDLLTWFAPLSRLSLKRFVIISVVARTPAILCSTIMGDSMIQGNWVMFFAIFFVTALAGLGGIQFRDKIVKRLAE